MFRPASWRCEPMNLSDQRKPSRRDSVTVVSSKMRPPQRHPGRPSVLAGTEVPGPEGRSLLISGSEVRVLHGSPAQDPGDLSSPSYENHPIAQPDHGPLTGSRRFGIAPPAGESNPGFPGPLRSHEAASGFGKDPGVASAPGSTRLQSGPAQTVQGTRQAKKYPFALADPYVAAPACVLRPPADTPEGRSCSTPAPARRARSADVRRAGATGAGS